MFKLFIFIASNLILLISFSDISYGDDETIRLEKELKTVRIKISNLESDLSKLRNDSTKARKALSEVESELKKLKEEEEERVVLLKTLSKQAESLELQIFDIEDQIDAQKKSFSDRIGNMYKSRRKLSSLGFLFLSSEVNSFYRRADYLRRLVLNDHEQIQEYETLVRTLEKSTKEFKSLKVEEEQAISELRMIKEDLLPKQLEQARLVKKLSDNFKKKKKVLKSYKAEAEELEEIIQNLTGANDPSWKIDTEPLPSFKKGSLPFPVKGEIIQSYGRHKHEEFSEMIFSKGIEISASVNVPVKVVAPGKVVFSSELPGFGNVVIVEHLGGYYTLYGRIKPNKFVDDEVLSEELIGFTTELDHKNRNFYFEIRKGGKSQNPEKYFTKFN